MFELVFSRPLTHHSMSTNFHRSVSQPVDMDLSGLLPLTAGTSGGGWTVPTKAAGGGLEGLAGGPPQLWRTSSVVPSGSGELEALYCYIFFALPAVLYLLVEHVEDSKHSVVYSLLYQYLQSPASCSIMSTGSIDCYIFFAKPAILCQKLKLNLTLKQS